MLNPWPPGNSPFRLTSASELQPCLQLILPNGAPTLPGRLRSEQFLPTQGGTHLSQTPFAYADEAYCPPNPQVPMPREGWLDSQKASNLLPASVTCTRLYAADIVFLLDGSSSIGRSNFREVRGFLEGLVLPFSGAARAQGVRFATVQYSDDPK